MGDKPSTSASISSRQSEESTTRQTEERPEAGVQETDRKARVESLGGYDVKTNPNRTLRRTRSELPLTPRSDRRLSRSSSDVSIRSLDSSPGAMTAEIGSPVSEEWGETKAGDGEVTGAFRRISRRVSLSSISSIDSSSESELSSTESSHGKNSPKRVQSTKKIKRPKPPLRTLPNLGVDQTAETRGTKAEKPNSPSTTSRDKVITVNRTTPKTQSLWEKLVNGAKRLVAPKEQKQEESEIVMISNPMLAGAENRAGYIALESTAKTTKTRGVDTAVKNGSAEPKKASTPIRQKVREMLQGIKGWSSKKWQSFKAWRQSKKTEAVKTDDKTSSAPVSSTSSSTLTTPTSPQVIEGEAKATVTPKSPQVSVGEAKALPSAAKVDQAQTSASLGATSSPAQPVAAPVRSPSASPARGQVSGMVDTDGNHQDADVIIPAQSSLRQEDDDEKNKPKTPWGAIASNPGMMMAGVTMLMIASTLFGGGAGSIVMSTLAMTTCVAVIGLSIYKGMQTRAEANEAAQMYRKTRSAVNVQQVGRGLSVDRTLTHAPRPPERSHSSIYPHSQGATVSAPQSDVHNPDASRQASLMREASFAPAPQGPVTHAPAPASGPQVSVSSEAWPQGDILKSANEMAVRDGVTVSFKEKLDGRIRKIKIKSPKVQRGQAVRESFESYPPKSPSLKRSKSAGDIATSLSK